MLKNIEKGIVSNESNKNEEDQLAYTSQYKTEIIKEDETKENEEEKNIIRSKSDKSTSISISQENFESKNFQRRQTLSKEEITFKNIEGEMIPTDKERKMSSPLISYYFDSDKFLSETQTTTINLKNSPNFVSKKEFFNNPEKIKNNYFMKYCSSREIKKNILYQKNNSNIINPLFMNIKSNSNDLNINNKKIINNNYYFQNNNFQPQSIYNINFINFNNVQNNPNINCINKRKLTYTTDGAISSNYFNNILGQNINYPKDFIYNVNQGKPNFNPSLFSYNQEQNMNRKSSNISNKNKTEKKPFDKRKGDWF